MADILFNKSNLKNILLIMTLIFSPIQLEYLAAQTGKAKSLKIGNKWVYQYSFNSNLSYRSEEVSKDTSIWGINYAVISHEGNYFTYERADSIRIYGFSLRDNLEYIIEDFSQTDTIFDNTIVSVDTVEFWGKKRIQVCNYTFHPFLESHICSVEGIGEIGSNTVSHGGNYSNTLLVSAYINGIKYGDTTLVVIKGEETKPESFYFSQNYPNPFNPTTKIKYRIAEFGFVNLIIYDVLGNEVAELVNDEKSPGEYEVEFNASTLSSGVYFYQIKIGNFIHTNKMVLMR